MLRMRTSCPMCWRCHLICVINPLTARKLDLQLRRPFSEPGNNREKGLALRCLTLAVPMFVLNHFPESSIRAPLFPLVGRSPTSTRRLGDITIPGFVPLQEFCSPIRLQHLSVQCKQTAFPRGSWAPPNYLSLTNSLDQFRPLFT